MPSPKSGHQALSNVSAHGKKRGEKQCKCGNNRPERVPIMVGLMYKLYPGSVGIHRFSMRTRRFMSFSNAP